MPKLFHYGFILFIVIGILMNRQSLMVEAMLNTSFQVFDLVKTLVLSACLWNGLLNIIQSSGIINHLSFFIKPILRFIYGKEIENPTIYQYLSSNILANLLGLGTLATISGLKAIKEIDNHHHQEKPCKAMKMLVVINTAGFSLIPTTMMTLRQNYHSQALLAFYPYSLAIGFLITLLGILIIKVVVHE